MCATGNNSSEALPESQGSGFVWDTAGHIITNNHVVEGADALQVTFNDGIVLPAEVVGRDPDSDLAVIQVDPTLVTLTPVEQGDINEVQVGQRADRHRQPVRAGRQPDRRHRERHWPKRRVGNRLQHPAFDPDRRGHQPRQFGRPAAERARPGDRGQFPDPLGRARQLGCRIRHPDQHRPARRAGADQGWQLSNTLIWA